MIHRAIAILRRRGFRVLLRAALSKLRGIVANRSKSFHMYQHLFQDQAGLEIGGPSASFSKGGLFPIYPIVRSLDNCNYRNSTAWSTNGDSENVFRFDCNKQGGRQFICEAASVKALTSQAYDFVASSHMLEHTANPILVLTEWRRLLRPQGILLLILPNPESTFDHRRPVTSLEHLMADFEADMHEGDLTHLPEILALHDFQRDPDADDDNESFKLRGMRNFENRCLHHHVFDERLAKELVEYAGWTVLMIEKVAPHHIVLLGTTKPLAL